MYDLTVGNGAEAKAGSKVKVKHFGIYFCRGPIDPRKQSLLSCLATCYAETQAAACF